MLIVRFERPFIPVNVKGDPGTRGIAERRRLVRSGDHPAGNAELCFNIRQDCAANHAPRWRVREGLERNGQRIDVGHADSRWHPQVAEVTRRGRRATIWGLEYVLGALRTGSGLQDGKNVRVVIYFVWADFIVLRSAGHCYFRS